MLAVAQEGGSVGVYADDGLPVDPAADPQIRSSRGAEVLCVQWHPFEPLLAVGWSDGVLTLWDARERRAGEDKVTHTAAVQVLQWSPDGRRLVAGDASGKLGVYKVDRRRPIPVVKYQVHYRRPPDRLHAQQMLGSR
jgi:intraflagellar transport protein 140